jgi:hypothetical protein
VYSYSLLWDIYLHTVRQWQQTSRMEKSLHRYLWHLVEWQTVHQVLCHMTEPNGSNVATVNFKTVTLAQKMPYRPNVIFANAWLNSTHALNGSMTKST